MRRDFKVKDRWNGPMPLADIMAYRIAVVLDEIFWHHRLPNVITKLPPRYRRRLYGLLANVDFKQTADLVDQTPTVQWQMMFDAAKARLDKVGIPAPDHPFFFIGGDYKAEKNITATTMALPERLGLAAIEVMEDSDDIKTLNVADTAHLSALVYDAPGDMILEETCEALYDFWERVPIIEHAYTYEKHKMEKLLKLWLGPERTTLRDMVANGQKNKAVFLLSLKLIQQDLETVGLIPPVKATIHEAVEMKNVAALNTGWSEDGWDNRINVNYKGHGSRLRGYSHNERLVYLYGHEMGHADANMQHLTMMPRWMRKYRRQILNLGEGARATDHRLNTWRQEKLGQDADFARLLSTNASLKTRQSYLSGSDDGGTEADFYIQPFEAHGEVAGHMLMQLYIELCRLVNDPTARPKRSINQIAPLSDIKKRYSKLFV